MIGISESQVSALCQEIDTRVQPFLERPLEGEWSCFPSLTDVNLKKPGNSDLPRVRSVPGSLSSNRDNADQKVVRSEAGSNPAAPTALRSTVPALSASQTRAFGVVDTPRGGGGAVGVV